MSWQIEQIPILENNFVFVLHDQGQAWIIDPGSGSEVLHLLERKKLEPSHILITHHHHDHIDGIAEILREYPQCQVSVPAANATQIPLGKNLLTEGQRLQTADLDMEIWHLPGHTQGHIAYWVPRQRWLFCGDVLFALGCGRLFEGTHEQMFHSLQRIKALPSGTLIFCTHDYFATNQAFAKSLGISITNYENHIPLRLEQEREYNPFLKAANVAEFTRYRQLRDHF